MTSDIGQYLATSKIILTKNNKKQIDIYDIEQTH